MTRRMTTFSSFLMAATFGALLFTTSEAVQRQEKRLNEIQEKIQVEKDSLRLLRAEWAYLNRPDRLQALNDSHLKMETAPTLHLLTSAKSIPEPPVVLVPQLPGQPVALVTGTKKGRAE